MNNFGWTRPWGSFGGGGAVGEILGPELIDPEGWTLDASSAVLAGDITNTSASATAPVDIDVNTAAIEAGEDYRITFDIDANTAGGTTYEFRFKSSGGVSDWTSSFVLTGGLTGAQEIDWVFTNSGSFEIRWFFVDATGSVVLRNMSVKKKLTG